MSVNCVCQVSINCVTFQADVGCAPGIAAAVALVIPRLRSDRVRVHAGGHGSQGSQATRIPQRQQLCPTDEVLSQIEVTVCSCFVPSGKSRIVQPREFTRFEREQDGRTSLRCCDNHSIFLASTRVVFAGSDGSLC